MTTIASTPGSTGTTAELNGRTIAFLVAPEGTEQVELTQPWNAVKRAGGTPRLISTEPGRIQAFDHLTAADTFPVDMVVEDADAGDFAGLLLPGGVANPDNLRTHPGAVALVQDFVTAGIPIAAICHAPWTLIEAGAVAGRTLTSWPSLATDIRNAGGTWVDQQVVIDSEGPTLLVTSRKPGDLDAFDTAAISAFAGRSGK
ncbi:type 1 glutamine amidotransferase domain-containing protein [Allonocardiopsis opalescens]|uniref:Protease I n=1 Tax=Allonocardiopsis opalescens TaxID=1144618 RepID=A0A2T0Q4B9_9ACTN|nr:type 1 glutamine amidotransferase domain-containing protein [Allonocardiopsis opalescens]PRX98551.1 protease I [Allonocardiopsis opalescens]